MKITVIKKGRKKYKAIYAEPGYYLYGLGFSANEAIGEVIKENPEVFSIEIEYKEGSE